jgi:hypothetical protein
VKALVAAVALLATILAVAGLGTLLVERRLAALAPGGVDVGALHYNPLTGWLSLGDVRARDAAGREIFSADSVRATASPLRLVSGALALGRVRVNGPRLTLHADAGLDLGEVHAFLGAPTALGLPLSIDDLVIGDGMVTIDGAGEAGVPLVVRDLDLRLSRLTTATAGERDVAFAVEMAVYGTLVHVTGQPRGAGYAVRVRARGLDAPALIRDMPALAAFDGVERGRAEIDADLVLTGGRVLASGFVRLTDAVVMLPVAGEPRLRAASLAVSADAFDLTAGAGRITRVDLSAPSLTLPAPRALAALNELLAPLRDDGALLVRRVSIADGTLTLDGPGGLRLGRLQLAAHLQERRTDSGWVVSGRAALAPDAEVSIDGLVARDFRALDAVTRLGRVPLATWRLLAGAPPAWDARVTFDGRLRLVAREGQTLASVTGQAELTDVTAAAAGGFRAERIALGIRQLRWPAADAVFDRVVLTRPTFGVGALAAWTSSTVTVGMSVVDGQMRGEPGHALRNVALELLRDDTQGLARLTLSASTETGARVALDRVVAATPAEPGLPLGLLAVTLDEAARFTPAPSALPASALP